MKRHVHGCIDADQHAIFGGILKRKYKEKKKNTHTFEIASSACKRHDPNEPKRLVEISNQNVRKGPFINEKNTKKLG